MIVIARGGNKKSQLKLTFLCRDDKIRTCGLFVPNEARYRAALHPEPVFSDCKNTKNYYRSAFFINFFSILRSQTKSSDIAQRDSSIHRKLPPMAVNSSKSSKLLCDTPI